jgi:hypothetical protein
MTPLDSYKLLTFTVSTASAKSWHAAIVEMMADEYWSFVERPLDLTRIYRDAPTTGGNRLSKYVIWQTTMVNSTVFVSNDECGWPMLTTHLSRVLPESFIAVRIANDLKSYPVCSMYYLQNGKEKRCLQALKDRGWQFHQSGDVLPIEDPSNYSRKPVSARFTKEICIGYLEKLGFAVSNPSFWTSNGRAFYGNRLSWDIKPQNEVCDLP